MTLPLSPSPAPTQAEPQTQTPEPAQPPSAGPATQPGPKINLRYFTKPDILLQIGCRRLARLLEPFSQELMPLNLPQPPDADEDPIYPPALAAALAASEPTLPQAVAKVLLTIEAAAAPENLDRLHDISLRYFPNLNPTILCPLSRALDVWLFYPEQLAPFAPTETPQQAPSPADSVTSKDAICHEPPATNSVDTNEGGAPAPFAPPETAQQIAAPTDSAIAHPAICREPPATQPTHLDHPYTSPVS